MDIASRRRVYGVLVKRAVDEVTLFTTSTGGRVLPMAVVAASLKALEYAVMILTESAQFAKLAEKTGDNTSSVIRLLGKKAIHLAHLIYQVVAAMLFLTGLIAGAIWAIFSSMFKLRLIFASQRV